MGFVLTVKRWVWSTLRLPRCKGITFLISQSLDRKLSAREELLLRFHFLGCLRCARYRKQLKIIRTVVQKAGRDDATSVLNSTCLSISPEAQDRLKKRLSGT